MDAIMPSLISAILSGCVVGIVMALFQRSLDKSVEDTRDANSLKFKNVLEKVEQVQKKTDTLDFKMDQVVKDMNRVDTRLALVKSEQEHLVQNISDLKGTIQAFQDLNYGKVIRK